jgi:EAL domain-containing protein (putative c-di-GMP-specific phosphodiesterase class I)
MTYGFLYGNKILEQIAFKVRNLIGPGDMFFRFDGNRFILVVEDYVDHSELLTLAQKLESIFENPFNNGTEHQYVNAEIAIVEIKDKDTSVDRVLQDASLTLSQIDRATKNPIRFFNEEMESKILRQEKIAKVLRAVIDGEDTDSFYLEFQPKLDLKRNTIIGFEALARLYTEELGQVSPFEFIAIAEEKLLIYDLGNQILLLAIEFMNHLRKQGYEDVGIAVNISGIQLLREEFLESVRHYIKRIDKNNLFLEFEITESVLIDEFDIINEKLEEIKKMGISISLDDFGTGFSSFSRLRELNIDAVKIDKYFINKISYKNEDDLITTNIISMSHKIGLTVIAEGVEEMRQKEYLKEHGCDIIQGYLLSKPLPQNKAIEFLTGYNG